MNHCFYFVFISILFSLVTNVNYDPVLLPFEVNDEEVKNVMVLVKTIWIYTKISKDSQIIMDITSHDENRVINKEDIRYGKYFKETNKTELAPIVLYVKSGNKYKLTYDVSKDQNDYGVIEITNLVFNQKLTIEVSVVSKTTAWIFIVGGIILGLILIIGIIVLCKKFLSCCKK